jgi:hypothetical protein
LLDKKSTFLEDFYLVVKSRDIVLGIASMLDVLGF